MRADPRRAGAANDARPYVFAAGLQHRDYATLLEACDGLGVDVRIAASSLWSKHSERLRGQDLPPWVHLGRFSYAGLRDEYAGAVAVVVPTVAADFPAGVTSVLEAMSMARPLVVTATAGNVDSAADRRQSLRPDGSLPTARPYASVLHPARPELHGQTGLYVPVGDAGALRSALQWVLRHSEEAEAMGRRARAVARAVHDVDDYVERSRVAVAGLLASRP